MRTAVDLAAGVPWLITEEGLRQILAIAARSELDQQLAAEIRAVREAELEAAAGKRAVPYVRAAVTDGVAVIPISGPIFRKANVITRLSGATSTQQLTSDFRTALSDPDVKGIVLSIDSPGGEAMGIGELADEIYDARAEKPVVSHVSGMAASAAYWLGSAASRMVLTKVSMVGSIGARMAVVDTSMAEAQRGIRQIDIVSTNAPRKGVDPASAQGQAQILAILDAIEDEFISSVARARNVSIETVKADFGQGGIIPRSVDAIRLGMADGIGTLESVIRTLATAGTKRSIINAAVAAPSPGVNMEEKSTAAPQIAATPETAQLTPVTNIYVPGDPKLATSEEVAKLADATADHYKSVIAKGHAEGVAAERARHLELDALARDMPGHGDLVAKAKAEGMSPADFAVALVRANGQVLAAGLSTRRQQETAIAAVLPTAPVAVESGPTAIDQNLPLEDRAKLQWDRDPALRADFVGGLKSYIAYLEATESGHAKILKRVG